MKIAAGFLAGGLARMGGGDKAEIQLAGRSAVLAAETAHIDIGLINADGPAARRRIMACLCGW